MGGPAGAVCTDGEASLPQPDSAAPRLLPERLVTDGGHPPRTRDGEKSWETLVAGLMVGRPDSKQKHDRAKTVCLPLWDALGSRRRQTCSPSMEALQVWSLPVRGSCVPPGKTRAYLSSVLHARHADGGLRGSDTRPCPWLSGRGGAGPAPAGGLWGTGEARAEAAYLYHNIEIKRCQREGKKGERTAAVPQTDLPSATHDLHVTFSGLICTSLTAIDLTRFMQMTPEERPNSHCNQVIMYVQLSTAMKN